MVLSRWFREQLKKQEEWHRLKRRIEELEKTVESLRPQVEKQVEKQIEKETEIIGSPTIIEYLNVEKIVVDRYEQSNNFGALGIKSLEGRLNIGANYGLSEAISDEKQKAIDDKLKKAAILYKKKMPQKPEQTKTSPKTTIRSMSGDAS